MELREFIPQVFELHAAGEYEAARRILVDAMPEVRTLEWMDTQFAG